VRLHQSAADLAEVLRSGAGADQELRELWQTAEHERRVDAGTIIDALLRNGPLKAGLDRESAVDILWILASADKLPTTRAGTSLEHPIGRVLGVTRLRLRTVAPRRV
jgi:hypothetical protein